MDGEADEAGKEKVTRLRVGCSDNKIVVIECEISP